MPDPLKLEKPKVTIDELPPMPVVVDPNVLSPAAHGATPDAKPPYQEIYSGGADGSTGGTAYRHGGMVKRGSATSPRAALHSKVRKTYGR